MKKSLQILALLFCITIFAQAPEKFSYQAVIRNASNALVTNSPVGMKISIVKNSATGTVVYAETQTVNTNAMGLASLQIGEGTTVTGTIAGIDWSSDSYYIKTETDPNGGNTYTISGTSQLLSVPYAMYAKNSSLTLPYAGISSADGVIPFKITNASATNSNAASFENTGAANTAAAVSGKNNSTTGFGAGVLGVANSNTNGNSTFGVSGSLLGTGTYGAGVSGNSQNAFGVMGNTQNGVGVIGFASGSGTAGLFQASNSASALNTTGALKFNGINEGAGKVLTSDASGNATWQNTETPFIHFSSVGGSNQVVPRDGPIVIINTWTGIEETGGENYNFSTGEYTIPITGYYSINAKIGFTDSNTGIAGQANVSIAVDGLRLKSANSNFSVPDQSYSDISANLEKKLNVGQKISVEVFQLGTPVNYLDPESTNFTINLLHK